jgi:hypothetical protein
MKNEFALLLVILILIFPYSILFYKKINLRIRLLFISMAEISILCILLTIDFLYNGFLTSEIFFYGQYVWITVFINIIFILLNWIFEKIQKSNKKSNH